MKSSIAQIRAFNRAVTRSIGLLDAHYLNRPRPLAQSRLLFEIARNGETVRNLRGRLGLDSGYLSRLIQALENDGLVEREADPGDARARMISLTPAGQAELSQINALSDEAADELLARLSPAQRERMVTAMGDVEHLLRIADLVIDLEPGASVDGLWCIQQYFNELARRLAEPFDPNQTQAVRHEEMVPPKGYLFVARTQGEALGCGALKVLSQDFGLIKHLWIADDLRGSGLGRRLLRRLEDQARQIGLAEIGLDTNRALSEAIQLYKTEGYRETEPFNDEPYAHHWFKKRL